MRETRESDTRYVARIHPGERDERRGRHDEGGAWVVLWTCDWERERKEWRMT
ncbi:hypothetical protein KDAU_74690 [Dictyobacter aurantiacus]|uniref:Uncharacterized protein n=1 Tax=Dictyobacter aurantiacus TaxID=1936993 RepID=A0A401ZLS5_9CHLR|nr:hypothetical protein KDAU_00020 [Dictyobacter aurantiacus]GCE07774.1 hypothetical protein KDAU_51030 [Dictyobacter aurantiacus]GCE07777.1 hypothetical protein KDAU_51060 [Dictyobacter aurantiacus]GCE10140.1 hypothetical protein KDAU_74690 [Dictyobacter aurantiacus]